MKISVNFTPDEMMAVCMARQVQDGEVVAQGLATPLAAAAYLLARHTHAPHLYFASAIGQGICRRPAPLGLARVESLWLDRALNIYPRGTMAVVFGHTIFRRQALLYLRGVQKALHQRPIDFVAKETESRIITLGDQGSKFQLRQVEQKYMHRVTQVSIHGLLAHVEVSDIGFSSLGRSITQIELLEKLQSRGINPRRYSQQVIGLGRTALDFCLRQTILPTDIRHSSSHQVSPIAHCQLKQVAIKAAPLRILYPSGTGAPMHRCYPLLAQRGVDTDTAQIHM